MRETSFIKKNEDKWREFERELEKEKSDPDKLNDLFVEITDDLSYARTFYPNRSVRVYLNGVAQKVFSNIYKSKSSKRKRFATFWKDTLPLLLFEARQDLRLALAVFMLAVGIGIISSAADPEFTSVILGDDYVAMTKENIKSGDPMAVYKERGKFNMFLGITANNMRVALITFLLGVFYLIGTIGILLFNGIMLGSFQYFFVEQGLFQESFLTIWMHGALEISAIVIAGAAGITVGRGLAFPGTLPRVRSFQLAARRGMTIFVGVLPLLLIAGFIEGFFTRFTDAPDILRGLFIFVCFAFVYSYYWWYPKQRASLAFKSSLDSINPNPEIKRAVDFSRIKTTGELFTDTFLFLRTHIKKIFWAAFTGASIYALGAFFGTDVTPRELFDLGGGFFLNGFVLLPDFFNNIYHPWLSVLMIGVMGAVAFVVQFQLTRIAEKQQKLPASSKLQIVLGFLKVLVVTVPFVLLAASRSWGLVLLIPFVFPLLYLASQIMLVERRGLHTALGRTFALTGGTYLPMLGLFLTLLLCGALFYLLIDSLLLYFLLDMVSSNLFDSVSTAMTFNVVVIAFVSIFMLLLIFGMWVAGAGLQYFSNLEIQEGHHLKKQIENIGVQRRIKGLEREG